MKKKKTKETEQEKEYGHLLKEWVKKNPGLDTKDAFYAACALKDEEYKNYYPLLAKWNKMGMRAWELFEDEWKVYDDSIVITCLYKLLEIKEMFKKGYIAKCGIINEKEKK